MSATNMTLFTLPTKQADTIKLVETPLRREEEATYLVVTFDKKQTLIPEIQNSEAKAQPW